LTCDWESEVRGCDAPKKEKTAEVIGSRPPVTLRTYTNKIAHKFWGFCQEFSTRVVLCVLDDIYIFK